MWVVTESWQQELEAAGHIASLVRKQRDVNAGAQLFHQRPQPEAVGLPASVKIVKKNSSQTGQRIFFPMAILNPFKLIISNHHIY